MMAIIIYVVLCALCLFVSIAIVKAGKREDSWMLNIMGIVDACLLALAWPLASGALDVLLPLG